MSIATTIAARNVCTVALVLLGALTACGEAAPTMSSATSLDQSAVGQSAQASSRLALLFDKASAEVLGVPGTVFADHDERRGRMVFGVETMTASTAVQAAAARAGLVAADFVIVLSAPVRLMVGSRAVAAGAAGTLSDTQSPVVGGVAIGTGKYQCTLGFTAMHAQGRSFITNSHCTDKQGSPDKTVFYQPAFGTGTMIGIERDDPGFNASKACPKDRKCRYSDAARVVYSADVVATQGAFATTSGVANSTVIEDIETFAQQDDVSNLFSLGTFYKVGITTGFTSGTSLDTCTNFNVANSNITLLCQTSVKGAENSVDFGDSGAPVYRKNADGSNVLVGILWGSISGNTYVFSPLEGVVRELGPLSATSR